MLSNMASFHLGVLLAIAGCAAASNGFLVPGEWSTVNSTFTPRDKHSVACVDDDIYIYGGRETSSILTDTLFKFSTKTHSYTQLFADQPPPIFGTTMFKIGRYLYQFGGQTDPTSMTNDMWKYDTERNTWRPIVKGAQAGAAWPPASAKFGGVERLGHDSFVIFLGVTSQGLSKETWSFNALKESWTLLHAGGNDTVPGPTGRFDPCCTYIQEQDKTYCFGGTDAGGDHNDMWVFDHSDNTWSVANASNTKPAPRRLAVCSRMLTTSVPKIAVHSGWDSTDLVFINDTDVHVFDVNTVSWTSIQQQHPKMLPRDSAKMCTTNEGIYLVGGATEPYLVPENRAGRLNDLWFFNETTLQFELRDAGALRPAPRVGHNLVVVGTNAWLFFGHSDSNEFHTGVWRLDLITLEWHSVATTGFAAPRHGASAASFGATVYFFGGIDKSGAHTNTLASFNTVNKHWQSLPQKGAIPAARAYHSAVFSDHYMIIIGGHTASATHTDDIDLFSIQQQAWFSVAVEDDAALGARTHAALLLDPFTEDIKTKPSAIGNKLRLFGGYKPELHTRSDRLVLDKIRSEVSSGTTSYRITLKTLGSVIPDGEGVKSYNRAEAAVGGAGSHYFVCGGTIDTSFPMVLSDLCYQYDANVEKNVRMTAHPSVPVFGGQGIYFGSKFIMFGGQLASEGLKRQVYTNELQIFTVAPIALCLRNNSIVDEACIHCSPGTYNPTVSAANATCEIGQVGQFHWNSFAEISNAQSCPSGLVSSIPAATSTHFCELCPPDQRAVDSASCEPCPAGVSCPIGSSVSSSLSSGDDSSVLIDTENSTLLISQQPSEYKAPPIPFWIYLVLIIVICGVFLTLTVLWAISGTGANTMVKYYMTEDQTQKLEAAYERYMTPGFGLQEVNLINTLYDFGITTIDMETASEEFRLHDLDGSSHIALDELYMLVCSLFKKQKVPCLKGTEAYDNNRPVLDQWKIDAAMADQNGEELPKPDHVGPSKFVERILVTLNKFNFATYDKYIGNHLTGKMGDVIKIQATTAGGLASMTFYLLTVVLVAALVLTFWYGNVVETKSTVPLVTVNETMRADMTITVESIGGTTNDLSHQCRSTTGGNINNKSCDGGYTHVELSQDVVTQFAAFQSEGQTTSCETVSPSCIVTYKCTACTIQALRSIYFDFSLTPDAFARQIRVNVSATTGITDASSGDEESSLMSVVLSPPEGTVLRGYPASEVNVRLVPTKFKKFKNAFEQNSKAYTGYHAQVISALVGNTVGHQDFGQFAAVPIRVSLQAGDTVLLVERNPIQNVLQLITSILGAISGLSGVLLAFVSMADARGVKEREEIRLKALKMKDREQFLQYIDEVEDENLIAQQLDARNFVEGLVEEGVSIQVAQAHLYLIRKCINHDKQQAKKKQHAVDETMPAATTNGTNGGDAAASDKTVFEESNVKKEGSSDEANVPFE